MSKLELDALLKGWPAPAREESAWEERADAIVRAALAAPEGADVSPALFEAPSLAAEPGEPPAQIVSVGESKMSQDSEQSASSSKRESTPPSAAPSTVSSPKSTERKRGSLKEIAARASQAGASSRPGSMAPPAPVSRTGSTTLVSATSTPLPSRPAEAGREDSGIVDLNVVKEKATPEQKAAAEKAQPASEGLFDEQDDKPKVAAAAAVTKIPVARPEEKKKGSGGVIAGFAIAALGLAAAFAIYATSKPAQQTQPTAATESKPTPGEQANPQAAPKPAEPAPVAAADNTAQPAPAGDPASGSTEAPSGGGEKVAAAPGGGTAGAHQPSGGSAAPPSDEKSSGGTAEAPSTPQAAPTTPAKPGDLKGAMAAAVGEDGTKKDTPTAEQAEPAAGSRNQSIPEQPSQGQVNAAIRGVMPSVKACVAGADDVSRATVTFASNGTVKSVSVSGWASSHGATGCIQAALKGANVGPFSKATFTTGFPIRP